MSAEESGQEMDGTEGKLEGADKDTFNEFLDIGDKNEEAPPAEEEKEKPDKNDKEEGEKEPAKEEDKEDKKLLKEEESDSSIDSAIEDALKEDIEIEAKETETDLEFSEDSPLSDEIRNGLIKLDKSADIDTEVLEEVGDLLEAATVDGHSAAVDAFKEQAKERREAMYANPLLNSENRESTAKNIEAAIKRFGGENTKDLMKFFNSHHSYDSNLVTFLNNIGEAVSEKPELGGKTTPSKGKVSDAEKAIANARKDNPQFFQ